MKKNPSTAARVWEPAAGMASDGALAAAASFYKTATEKTVSTTRPYTTASQTRQLR